MTSRSTSQESARAEPSAADVEAQRANFTSKPTTAGRVVVGTDGSLRAHKAVEWAANRASARKLPLLILLIAPEVPLPTRTSAAAAIHRGSHYVGDVLNRARDQVEAEANRIRAQYPGLDVAAEVVLGHDSDVLIQASKDAAQVVVGARGEHTPISVKLLGGVSDAVVSHAHGPVAVIGDLAEYNLAGPVVVGIDDSPEAMAAARIGFEAATVRGVPVLAVNAWDFGTWDAIDSEVWDHSMVEISTGLVRNVESQLADLRAEYPNVEVSVRVVRSRPEDALVAASKDAGLVVVGSRGRGGFLGLLIGSTSKHVLREAHCPVIVTRASTDFFQAERAES